MLLLPPSLDDDVAADNPVRAIDASVDMLDLRALGFGHADARSGSGQPPYDPALLLKLSMYGDQNRLRRSRQLEASTRVNVEVMWLCRKACPSSKTIAAFRKTNAKALKRVNRDFVRDCRELSLVGGRRVAVDGTFLKARAHRGRVHTKDSLERGLACLGRLIGSPYRAMDAADATEPEGTDPVDPDLVRKMAEWLSRRAAKKALQDQLEESGGTQVSEIDPDAQLLCTSGRSVVGYKGPIAVDDKAKRIVATDVVPDGNDHHQREPMMTQASEAVGNEGVVGLADAGYANAEQLKGCEDRGMKMYVPRPDTAIRKGKDGRFGRADFRDDRETDSYVCPAVRTLDPNGSIDMSRGKRSRV